MFKSLSSKLSILKRFFVNFIGLFGCTVYIGDNANYESIGIINFFLSWFKNLTIKIAMKNQL